MIPAALLRASKARVIIDPSGHRRDLGRLWVRFNDEHVTVSSRRSTVATGTVESVTEIETSKIYELGLEGGAVWRMQLGCGCGGR